VSRASLVALGGLGVVGVLYLLSRRRESFEIAVPAGAPQPEGSQPGDEPPYTQIRRSVVAYVAGRESGRAIDPGATNLNTDSAGLSYGITQWAQKTGMLGALLNKMYAADPEAFKQIFGMPWKELLSVTNAKETVDRMKPVGGVLLWQEPWVGRFKRAAQHPPFVEAQWKMAEEGPHIRGAEKIARILNTKTPRALVLFLDRTNQQGAGNPLAIARSLAAKYAVQRPAYEQILQEFRTRNSDMFRSNAPKSDGVWKKVGNEWHRFTSNGKIDLYLDIMKRTDEILNDPQISDQPIIGFPEEAPSDTAAR
jgi:hypothetical protein